MNSIVTIHSFRRGVGKTSLAANLAVLLALQGRRVALVDRDFQTPSARCRGSGPETRFRTSCARVAVRAPCSSGYNTQTWLKNYRKTIPRSSQHPGCRDFAYFTKSAGYRSLYQWVSNIGNRTCSRRFISRYSRRVKRRHPAVNCVYEYACISFASR